MLLSEELQDVLESEVTLNLEKHPFFTALRSGTMHKASFIDAQSQLAHLVFSISPAMAAVLADPSNRAMRADLVENLWSEQVSGLAPTRHHQKILALIESLGSDGAVVDASHCGPAVTSFNMSLKEITQCEDSLMVAAVFVGVGRLFSDASSLTFRALVKRGWLGAGDHAFMDEMDSDEDKAFLRLADTAWMEMPESRATIKCGIKLGAALLTRVFTNLVSEPVCS